MTLLIAVLELCPLQALSSRGVFQRENKQFQESIAFLCHSGAEQPVAEHAVLWPLEMHRTDSNKAAPTSNETGVTSGQMLGRQAMLSAL